MNKPARAVETPHAKANYERDHQQVRGIFKNLETPGQKLTFFFRRYLKDQVKKYVLEHDVEATVPYMVAEHINNNCSVEQNSLLLGPDGRPVTKHLKPKSRFAFIQTSFSRFQENKDQKSSD